MAIEIQCKRSSIYKILKLTKNIMTQKINQFISKFWFRIFFIITGLGSLIWFLIRVVPKPSRATYPCMKAAAPLASSFVTYIMGLSIFAFVAKKAKSQLSQSKYLAAFGLMIVGLIAGSFAIFSNSEKASASYKLASPQEANVPLGEGKGVFPGRVVWAHDPDATNENCDGNYWYKDENTNKAVVANMVSLSIQQLTGTTNDAAAWDQIFRNYNKTHGRGDVGYTPGEKIVIKINLNGDGGSWSTQNKNINTTPQVCLSILDQLVNKAGVAQSDIGIGDPSHNMSKTTYNYFNNVFPDVEYWGESWQLPGLTKLVPTAKPVFFYSDNQAGESLAQKYVDATYMINIPIFKKHHRAGISLCAKNHVGSISAFSEQNYSNAHWHESLVAPFGGGDNSNGEYGVYRCFVDFMGHKDLGGKTILYLVDAIWGSTNWGHPAVKYEMAPFNNDWPSSLFISLDPVAVESVCFDFLYNEFDEDNAVEGGTITDDKGPFPQFEGVDDFLHQAADPKSWAAGISYDPEDDGIVLGSLGTHEHWNNATDKQYSRNLSTSGTGIELYKANLSSSKQLASGKLATCSNFPNPVVANTKFNFNLDEASNVQIAIFNAEGKKVSATNLGRLSAGKQAIEYNGSDLKPGVYTYSIAVSNKTDNYQMTNKLIKK